MKTKDLRLNYPVSQPMKAQLIVFVEGDFGSVRNMVDEVD
jgi:hypothetical protein